MAKAADSMFLPVDAKTGIHLQDDGFLEKERWISRTRPEKYPFY